MNTQALHRLQSHTMYEKASFIQDYAVKVQIVLDKDRSAKRYKVRDIRGLQKLIEKESNNLDSIYIKWIIQKYSQNKMQMVEDILSKAIPALERYSDLKKRNQLQPNHKNLQRIKDIHELLDVMDAYRDTQSRSEQKDSIEQGFYDRGEAELVHDDSKIKVIIPKTEKASCYFGMGTQWCTTGDRNNQFNNYTRDGYDLYYIFFKGVKDKKNYKWAVAWNRKNHHVKLFDAQNRFPEQILQTRDRYPILQKIFKDTIYFDQNPSERVQLIAMEKEDSARFPIILMLLNNPSREIQMAIATKYPYMLKYIKDPLQEVQMFTVAKHAFMIKYFKNPSQEVQMAAVKTSPYAIKSIHNPSRKVQLAAVKRNMYTLEFIENPAKEVIEYVLDRLRTEQMPKSLVRDLHKFMQHSKPIRQH